MTKPRRKTEDEAPEIAPDDLATLQGVDAPPGDLAADLAAPQTINADEPWPPGAVVVYQDKHNAPATILKANDDHTLDLLADLHGLGREITLYGVARRQGSGNGWEPI